MEVFLNIDSERERRRVAMMGDIMTIGRSPASSVIVEDDEGLSRHHAAIQREGNDLRLVDKQSINGSYVNCELVPPGGTLLADGDEIFVGNRTVMTVSIRPTSHEGIVESKTSGHLTLFFAAPVLIAIVFIGAALVRNMSGRAREKTADVVQSGIPTRPDDADSQQKKEEVATAEPTPEPTVAPREFDDDRKVAEEIVDIPTGTRKLYKNMTDEDKREFIKERAGRIAVMMGKRPYAFTPDALEYIKFWLEAFAGRVGNNRTGLWRGDTRFILQRGSEHAPLIIRAFKENRVPPVIGLYIPFIETEYTNIHSNNAAGAAGLFQFLGPTAEHYGVPSSERTDVAKMAPAAARYFRDNIMSFGDDSMSVALAISGYNRAPESVKRDLRNVLSAANNEDKERNFWTLIANQGKLDHFFQNENKNYVPRFFAAAILGETPWAFGIEMRPLSTYTTIETELATESRNDR
jgi:FHA domain/Transglycosylase SLT domain